MGDSGSVSQNNQKHQKGTIMELYIGNIPKGARTSELKKLIKDTLKENVFSRLFDRLAHLGRLDGGISIAIHTTVTRHDTEDKYRYGHIKVDSSNLARLLLENVGGASLRGEALSVREYIPRDTTRDRRCDTASAQHWQGGERRVAERRRTGA
jgi:hypothetical protein